MNIKFFNNTIVIEIPEYINITHLTLYIYIVYWMIQAHK
jgi:hypothetical protein